MSGIESTSRSKPPQAAAFSSHSNTKALLYLLVDEVGRQGRGVRSGESYSAHSALASLPFCKY